MILLIGPLSWTAPLAKALRTVNNPTPTAVSLIDLFGVDYIDPERFQVFAKRGWDPNEDQLLMMRLADIVMFRSRYYPDHTEFYKNLKLRAALKHLTPIKPVSRRKHSVDLLELVVEMLYPPINEGAQNSSNPLAQDILIPAIPIGVGLTDDELQHARSEATRVGIVFRLIDAGLDEEAANLISRAIMRLIENKSPSDLDKTD